MLSNSLTLISSFLIVDCPIGALRCEYSLANTMAGGGQEGRAPPGVFLPLGNSGGGERASSGTRRAVNWAVLCATEGTQSRYSASGHCCRAQCAASAGRQKPHGRLHVRKLWRRPDACGREPGPKPHHSLHRMRRVQFNGHGPSLVRPFQSACFSLDVPPRGQPDQVRLVREWN